MDLSGFNGSGLWICYLTACVYPPEKTYIQAGSTSSQRLFLSNQTPQVQVYGVNFFRRVILRVLGRDLLYSWTLIGAEQSRVT
jgi:hypothetical protein